MGDVLDLFPEEKPVPVPVPVEAEEPLRAPLTPAEELPVCLPWPNPEDVPEALRGWVARERLGRRIYLHKQSNAWVSEENALLFAESPPGYRPRYFYRLRYLNLDLEYEPASSTLASS